MSLYADDYGWGDGRDEESKIESGKGKESLKVLLGI